MDLSNFSDSKPDLAAVLVEAGLEVRLVMAMLDDPSIAAKAVRLLDGLFDKSDEQSPHDSTDHQLVLYTDTSTRCVF